MTSKPRSSLLVFITFLFWGAMYTYMPTMTPYLGSLGISYVMIGIIGGAYGFGQMVLRIPLGIVSAKIGKRKIFIILGTAAGAISSIGMFFTQNAFLFVFFRLVAGASASAWVIFTVLFSSYFSKAKIASGISFLMIANYSGTMVAKLFGSYLAEQFGHQYSFLLGGALGTIALILSLFVTENVPPVTESPSVKSLLSVMKDKNLLSMSLLAVFTQTVFFATTNTFTPDAAARLGASSIQLGWLSTIATIPSIVCALICGKLFAKKINLRNFIAFSFVLEVVGTLMLPFSTNLPMIYAAVIIAGLGFGFSMVTMLSFCTTTVDESLRSVAMGVYQAVYGIGMFVGPVLIGMFVTMLGLDAGFYISAAIAGIGLLLSFVLIKK